MNTERSQRIRAALREKKAQGAKLGPSTLGFRSRMPDQASMVDDEIEAVRLILQRRGTGIGYRAIARELRAAGVRTKRGGKWYASTVRKIWLRRTEYEPFLRRSA